MKLLLLRGQLVPLFHLVQQQRHLVHIQADNLFFPKLWQLDSGRRVVVQAFCAVKIVVKAFEGADFALDPTLLVHDFLIPVVEAVFQIFHVFLEVPHRQLIQVFQSDGGFVQTGERGIFPDQKVEEYAQVIGVGDPGPGRGSGLDSPEKILAEGRQAVQHFPQL